MQSVGYPSPFENTFMVFTVGLLTHATATFQVVLVCCLPLAFASMDNNIIFNILMMGLSLLLGFSWIASSFITGINTTRVPATTPFHLKYGEVVGTVMLNLAATTVIPTWINLKHRDVNVQKLVWMSSIGTSVYYVIIGIICGWAFDLDDSGNLLHSLLIDGKPQIIANISIFVFAYVMLLPSIPVSFIVSRDNLVQNRVVRPSIATLLSIVLPWFILIPLQTGTAIVDFQSWMSLIFCSSANFIIPVLVHFQSIKFRREFNAKRILTKNQISLLLQIHSNSTRITSFIDKQYLAASDSNVDTPFMDMPVIIVKAPSDEHESPSLPPRITLIPPSEHSSVQNMAVEAIQRADDILGRSSIQSYHSGNSHKSRSSWIMQASDRDERVTLQQEIPDASAVFVDPSTTGLPLDILTQDVPEPEPLGFGRSADLPPNESDREHNQSTQGSGFLRSFFTIMSNTHHTARPHASPPPIPSIWRNSGEEEKQISHSQSQEIVDSGATLPIGSLECLHVGDTEKRSRTPSPLRHSPLLAATSLPAAMRSSTEGVLLAAPTLISQRRGSQNSHVSHLTHLSGTHVSSTTSTTGDAKSLPYEREYVAPEFHVVPRWIPISVNHLAHALLWVTIVICVGNLAFFAYLKGTGQT
eukprot:jgi/Hompol1/5685/HPOL_004622-RA